MENLSLIQMKGTLSVGIQGNEPPVSTLVATIKEDTTDHIMISRILVIGAMSYFRKLDDGRLQPITQREMAENRGHQVKNIFVVPIMYAPDLTICTSADPSDVLDNEVKLEKSEILTSVKVTPKSLVSEVYAKVVNSMTSEDGLMYQSINDSITGTENALLATEGFFDAEKAETLFAAPQPEPGQPRPAERA